MSPDVFTLAPVSSLVRGGMFFAGALLVGLLLRRRSAAWQAFFWRSVLLGSLGLTAVGLMEWGPLVVRGSGSGTSPSVEVHAFAFHEPPPAAVPRDLAHVDSPGPAAIDPGVFTGSGATAVWWLWGFGGAVVMLRWLVALSHRQRCARQTREVCDPDWLAILSEVSAPSRPPRLLRHPTAAVPCAWGVWRPTIMLPGCADQWSTQRRRMALDHEWSHLRRRDPLWQALVVLVLALHWANPLAWLAVRRWRLTEEQVADDAVLHDGHAPDSYAELLVDCARALASGHRQAPAAVSMAQPSTVPARIGRILDADQDRRRPGWLRSALCAASVAACLLAVLCVTPALTAQGKSDGPSGAEKPPGEPEDAGEVPKRQYASAAEGTAAAEVVEKFLLADGVESKLKYVRFPEKVAPLMRKWYQTHASGPVQSSRDEIATTLTKLIHVNDMEFIVVTIQLLPSLEYKFHAVESTPQGLKLDWETAVGWQPMSVEEFRKTRPAAPQPFRVHVGAGDYYNGAYADEKKWLCSELTYPGDDGFRFFGYVDRSSAAGKTLAASFAADKSLSAILAIARDRDGSESNQVTIHSIISEVWFLKDGPATTAPGTGK